MNKIDIFLDSLFPVSSGLPTELAELKNEFRIHLIETTLQHVGNGLSVEDSMNQAIEKFGLEKEVLQETYHLLSKEKSNFTSHIEPDVPFSEKGLTLEQLSIVEKYIITQIGQHGFSRAKDILKATEPMIDFLSFMLTDIRDAVVDLIDKNVLISESVSKISSRSSRFNMIELSPIGSSLYSEIAKRQPVPSDKIVLINQYATLEKAYFEKDCLESLKSHGYELVSKYTHEPMRLPMTIFKKEDKIYHILFDSRPLYEQDYFNLFSKWHSFSNEFYILSINENQLYSYTKRNLFMWINKELGGMNNAKGMSFHFSYLSKIEKATKHNYWESFTI